MQKILSSHDYNGQDYDPPIPALEIGLSRPGRTQAALRVEALIDTGADGTLIPRTILERAGAQFVDTAHIRGITGHREAVELYLVTVYIGEFRLHAIRVAAMKSDAEIIIGRDILSQLDLRLNGRAGVVDVLS